MPLEREREDKISFLAPTLIVICVIAGLFLWYMLEKPAGKVEEPQVIEEQQESGTIDEPRIKYPVPEIPAELKIEKALPEEEVKEPVESAEPLVPPPAPVPEPTVEEQFTRLFDWQKYSELFLLEALINHFVVTVDNMTGPKLPQKFTFTTPPPGKFLIRKDEAGMMSLDPDNYNRYKKFVEFAEAAEVGRFVSFYVRHYALFQAAYEELGYPDRYFNDRLVEVLDHILLTPMVQGPFKLEQPKVYYTFADSELEALSAGQKILIRIGPENAAKARGKIRELRQSLTTLKRQ